MICAANHRFEYHDESDSPVFIGAFPALVNGDRLSSRDDYFDARFLLNKLSLR